MERHEVEMDESDENPTQAIATDEDEILQSSQPDDAESQVLQPFSQATELQGSGETMLSQDSVISENEGVSLHLSQSDTKEESHIGSSSLEVEANNSTRENSSHRASNRLIEGEEDPFLTQGENLSEEYSCAELQIQDTKKRKCETNNSPVQWKKPKLEESSERKHSIEMVFESEGVKKEDSVVNISSSSERIVSDESEDFSLRIEESTQPTCPDESIRISQETEGLTSYTDMDKPGFLNSQSQKSIENDSWNFLGVPDDNCQSCTILKKRIEKLETENKLLRKEKTSTSSFNLEDSKKDRSSLEHSSAQVSLENSSKNDASTQEMHVHLVKVNHCEAVGDVILQYDLADKTVKPTNIIIKAVSLKEDFHFDCGKPNPRMSIMSTTSFKSSSSSGSVGLPGPFALPGRKRASIQSTISSSSSASSGFHNGRDARFLKNVSPMSNAKSRVSVKCCHCHLDIPHVEHLSSPLVNGSPQSPLVESEAKETKEKIISSTTSATSRRGRKGLKNQSTTVDSSSENQQKESSSSGSQPQDSSTTTLSPAVFPKPRGRPRKKPLQIATSPCMEATTSSPTPRTSTPIRQPSTLIRQTSTPSLQRTLNSTKGEAVLAWWSDGRWYPGWVKGGLQQAEGEVTVHYCDGHRKVVPLSKVVSASKIIPGTLVLALANSREYEEALVINVTLLGEEPVYHVERENNTRAVEFPSIAVLDSQISELTESSAKKNAAPLNFNDLSLVSYCEK